MPLIQREKYLEFLRRHKDQDVIKVVSEMCIRDSGSGDYDLVVLDEYNMALFFELISWDKTRRCSMLVIQKRNSYLRGVGLLKN